MKKLVMSAVALAASLAAPAYALEHEVVIDHADGPIAADYKGTVTIETRQVGTVSVAGRASTLSCRWTAKLNVERIAKVGSTLSSRRTLTSDDVASGARPGWCPRNPEAIAKLVDARSERVRSALLALVEQDRAALVAEADTATTLG